MPSVPGRRELLVNLSFVPRQPSGHAIYAMNVLPHLAGLAPRVLTAEPDRYPSARIAPAPRGMTTEQGGKGHAKRLLWTQFGLPLQAVRHRPSLLFSPIPEMPLWARCRSVVTFHDAIPLRFTPSSPLGRYFRHYVPRVLNQAQHIICNSEATRQEAVENYSVPPAKLTVVPMACDTAHFRPVEPDPDRPPYFLYLGRYDGYKNLEGLVDALAALPPDLDDHELWISGAPDPDHTPRLMDRAAARGVAHRVKALDYVPYEQLPSLLSGAVAFVLTSLWEGFGIPVLEAMACGTPVITSNVSALPEVAGDAALLVDPRDPGAIADAMRNVAGDGGLRSDLREKGFHRVSAYSWEQTGVRTRELLERFL